MQQYCYGVFVLCIVCALVELLSPAGEGGGIARHIKLMSALCVLCVLTQPLLLVAQEWEGIPDRLEEWLGPSVENNDEQKEQWEQQSNALTAEYAAIAIHGMLCEQFSMDVADCRVSVRLTEDGTALAHVRVALSGHAIWQDTHRMEAYLTESLACDCTIYIE